MKLTNRISKIVNSAAFGQLLINDEVQCYTLLPLQDDAPPSSVMVDGTVSVAFDEERSKLVPKVGEISILPAVTGKDAEMFSNELYLGARCVMSAEGYRLQHGTAASKRLLTRITRVLRKEAITFETVDGTAS